MNLSTDDAAPLLSRFERTLDPAHPTAGGGVEVLGYGEVSAALMLEALPGLVCKRMAGLRDLAAAERYRRLVEDYVAFLRGLGLAVADTSLVTVQIERRRPVVYLLQPRLSPAGLGNALLRDGDEKAMLACLDHVLDALLAVWRGNRERRDGIEVAVDAQFSNWHFAVSDSAVGRPTLFDIGTPFVRRGASYQIDLEIFLAAVPPLLRAWYRRARAVEKYLDPFFDPRGVAVDLLGNFHKEGRPDRVPAAANRVNDWLSDHADEFGPRARVDVADVDRYYANDSAQLDLFLKVRRMDRFVRTRLLRSRYEFVLPGTIKR